MRQAWLILMILLLAACSRDRTVINTSQSLVMESAVLSAGITTTQPVIAESNGQQRASATLYNEQEHAVRINYRFYWYDDRGLQILPFEKARAITVPAHSKAGIASLTGNLTASKVRLYLYL
ncbi:hypothetical protein BL250_03010 [Erwinia sp. OLTSP20]|uniref:YcfL family protein n=1 Tax=unclassified Erwinia TaxID=2622719 RepID=UPI000C1A1E48|nr:MULTISPECIES: DUF1425 domain-containing protein [unclassified Erwinia]PIJ51947.1 hypothetical protein BV501_01905 [Erwinia sp. OAMSP11]PIJ74822.1 hypothetical protein BK416_03245 [Erwinia sp. OLSSP12]PIJ85208.1 hypothetical protein BLD47_00985 [Erwinia sp. OLCASP19]PIJ87209.1 hypothetical protein BLD46_01380 [Erwinia sp. OLMTSP26]PIJ88353.1 hypothetical protein BLD49_02435 [Erwinia sp. OLMDSP33]